MTTRLLPCVLAAAAAVALPAPASAQNREHQQIAADARMLQEQVQQLSIALTTLSQSLAESINALNARLEAAEEAARRASADQRLLINNLSNDVRVIRESSQDTNVRITRMSEEVDALRTTVLALQRAAMAPPPQMPADPGAPVDPNAAPPPPDAQLPLPAPVAPPPSVAGLSPTRMYEEARGDFFLGQYAAAIAGFEAFVRTFPTSELADDAWRDIGESHYLQNRWDEAIAAYNQVIQNHPGTNSVPYAYYKRGMAQERSGRVEDARATWEELVNLFPDSTEAQLARQSLDRTGN